MAYQVERLLHVRLPDATRGGNVFDAYWSDATDDQRLTLLDFFLRDLQTVFDSTNDKVSPAQAQGTARKQAVKAARQLATILNEAGSVWRVTIEPYWSLTRRVNEASQALVDRASSPASDAARKIASAWNACYKHGPEYDKAYRDAVLAVEAVALPVVIPNDPSGTLGKAVAHMAQTLDRWSVGGLDAERQASGATVIGMLRTLWHNQERHAKNDGTVGDVSREEAETAVSLAVTLVHWFSAGLVKRRA
jgi:hypothetical protein